MIDCPACHREIAREFGEWLWKVTNCPYCLAPLMPVMDDLTAEADDSDSVFYFTTDPEWV